MTLCPALAAPALGGTIANQRTARLSSSGRPGRRCGVRVCAQGGSGEDLAKQFEAFKRRMNAQVDSKPNVSTAAPPRFSQQQRGGWNDRASDEVRRAESRLLNAWTSERGMQAAAAGTMLVVVALLVGAGGPPADPRCTLPWC